MIKILFGSTNFVLIKNFEKRQYGKTNIIFLQNFDQKIIWFNAHSLSRKFWIKDDTVQSKLSFYKFLTKRQHGSTHAVFFDSFNQKTILFKPYCLLGNFWPKYNMFEFTLSFLKIWSKDNMVQPILTFPIILTKRDYGSTDVAFWEHFDQKILFTPYCLSRKFWPKDNMVQPTLCF